MNAVEALAEELWRLNAAMVTPVSTDPPLRGEREQAKFLLKHLRRRGFDVVPTDGDG